ncbi:low molecular weight protein arginine phosphatase [Pontiella agarivorans]|uniref:protein-tyrosine-phosphatase n=1 Tax=Pontiella agarivorans TaxID=3038953 RepID=A0ABU5MVZ4_9BACT|nr:low molecular weight protein arginine phosphatase [Pontiella agarivorans]MDZ8118288.1 low molecular weight protein arginine phosphatase [Pontiella agarivorans]
MSMVLFICTGNTCRSPMAEALFLQRQGDMGWEARSAGIFANTGAPASPHSITAMKEIGIDITGHRSQPLTSALTEEADFILAMSSNHAANICERFPEVGNKVFLINAFGTSKVPADVSDPFGGTLNTYKRTRDEIDRALSDLILFIREGQKNA